MNTALSPAQILTGAPPGMAFTTRTSAMSLSSTASAAGAVDVLPSDFDVTAPVAELNPLKVPWMGFVPIAKVSD